MTNQEQLALWNQAALKVLDVRHAWLEPGKELQTYRLPASMFFYMVRGSADIRLDQLSFAAKGQYMCHGGKGAVLSVAAGAERVEYYMVFYKAAVLQPSRRQALSALQYDGPFMLQYGLAPAMPLPLYMLLEQMTRQWEQGGQLERLQVKALFHQFVYELQRQLAEHGEVATRPDLVMQAAGYMDDNYGSPITLSTLAELLGCHARQLQRLFKARLLVSPMEYLMERRMTAAMALLRELDVPLKQIAEAVGYTDSYYFSRMFKKFCGMSPTIYREQPLPLIRRQNPSMMSRLPIAGSGQRRYSVIGFENHYQYRDGEEQHMARGSRAGLAMTMILTLALMLAACSGGAGTGTNAGAGTTPASNTAQNVNKDAGAGTQEEQGKTRTIKHMKGELELKETPQKIVVLDVQYIDHMVALGKQPIGSVIATSDKETFPAYLADKLVDVKPLGSNQEPNVEGVLEAAPDLIIATEFQEKIYDDLDKIAPTLMFERNENWQTMLQTFGVILDKEQEAQQFIDQYNSRVAQMKSDLAAKLGDETVALLRPRDNAIRLHTSQHRTAEILYKDLGLKEPEMIKNPQDTAILISLEVLPDMNADHLFLLADDSNTELTAEFQATSIWKGLTAVQANHVYSVGTTQWIGYYGPLAINLILDDIQNALLK